MVIRLCACACVRGASEGVYHGGREASGTVAMGMGTTERERRLGFAGAPCFIGSSNRLGIVKLALNADT